MRTGGGIRLRLKIHYDGSRFHGWQVQPDVRTVQGDLEAATERLTGERRPVLGSGRTDTGVHATGQVASLLLPSRWSPREFRRAMNAVLPDDVWIEDASRVPEDFHPRYDATARTYEYRLGLSPGARSPFLRPWCWPLRDPVDRQALERCARAVPGERSFAAFGKAGQPHRGERCDVHRAGWSPWGGDGLRFRITADRYLHHMVRYLVGTMVDVARGRRPEEEMIDLLQSRRDDLTTSPPAPPEGLFLVDVEYPDSRIRTPEQD